ncbi:MAG: hypothetical protein MN733_30155 [Nitrososphaera sp.]|nr:hypothetical protein [Nitrososphaera sp.]
MRPISHHCLFCGAILLVACITLICATEHRDPSIDGIRLSAILKESESLWPTGGGIGERPRHYSRREVQLIESLHRIGEAALPFLFNELGARHSRVTSFVVVLAKRQSILKISPITPDQRRWIAWKAISELGVPQIWRSSILVEHSKELDDLPIPSPELKRRIVTGIVHCLEESPEDPRVWPRLLAVLYRIGPEAKAATSTLTKLSTMKRTDGKLTDTASTARKVLEAIRAPVIPNSAVD